MQARQQHVEQAAGPCPVSRCPGEIAGLGKEFVRELHARQVAEQDTMAMQRTLGLARRAGCIDHHGRIIGARGHGLELGARGFQNRIETQRRSIRSIGRDDDLERRQVSADLDQLGNAARIGDNCANASIPQSIVQRVNAKD